MLSITCSAAGQRQQDHSTQTCSHSTAADPSCMAVFRGSLSGAPGCPILAGSQPTSQTGLDMSLMSPLSLVSRGTTDHHIAILPFIPSPISSFILSPAVPLILYGLILSGHFLLVLPLIHCLFGLGGSIFWCASGWDKYERLCGLAFQLVLWAGNRLPRPCGCSTRCWAVSFPATLNAVGCDHQQF